MEAEKLTARNSVFWESDSAAESAITNAQAYAAA